MSPWIHLVIIFLFSLLVTSSGVNHDKCDEQFGSNCNATTTLCKPSNIERNERCDYIKCCCNDQMEDPKIHYLNFQYCDVNIFGEILNSIILFIILIYYTIILGNVADYYFAKIMADISDSMGLSHDIAGLTFLAFGNGAPDIAVSVAAIQSGGEQKKLGIGALLGAAVFCITLIPASIITYAVNEPIQIARRPLTRDCLFLLITAVFVLIKAIHGSITIDYAIIMIAIYILYIIAAISGRLYTKLRQKNSKKLKEKAQSAEQALSGSEDANYQSIDNDDDDEEDQEEENKEEEEDSVEMSRILSRAKSEKIAKEKNRHWFIKVLSFILNIPLLIIDYLFKVSIPMTSEENWNDYLVISSCIISPLWILYGFRIFFVDITKNGFIQLWLLALIWGLFILLITIYMVRKKHVNDSGDIKLTLTDDKIPEFTVSKVQMSSLKSRKLPVTINTDMDDLECLDPKKQPVLKYYFMFIGFLSAIAWINIVACELINIATTLGIALNIDLGIFGLTVLAFGNSVPDLFACIGVSKMGYPRMAISAAIGGSVLNILIGLGLGAIIVLMTENNKNTIIIPVSRSIFYGSIATIIGVTIYYFTVALSSWQLRKSLGYFLYLYYILFMVVSVLAYIYPNILWV